MIKPFFSLLGILFSCFIIWNKFIRERLPKDIYISIFSVRFYITIIILFGFILIIIFSMKRIFSVDKESVFSKLLVYKNINYIYNNILVPIKEGPKQLYELIYDSIKISFIIELIHRFFFNYNIYNYCKYIILFLKIWRILFVISFVLDVFHFHKFYYIYKTMYILIIPLICNFLLFIIDHHAKNLVEYLSNFIIVNYLEEEQNFTIVKNPLYTNELHTNTIIHFGDLYINALYTTKTFIHLNEMKKEINNYLNIYVFTLYLISWFYCIYFSSNFYYKTPEIKISFVYLLLIGLCFIYNFSFLIYKNNFNLFIYKKKIKFYEWLFIKRNNNHYKNFITDTIEKNVLLFNLIFNVIPKYLIVILLMFNILITLIPYYLYVLFCCFCIIFFSNIYLFFKNKHINLEIEKLERCYYFITENNTTNIYYKYPLEKHLISENLDGNIVLQEWVKLKEIETFIYYAITTKIKYNNYMNCIYLGLLLILFFILYI